ncbi:MAG: FtsX-like permease family protein, partial [bacterium]|nr:FtsX-like permease family protein [bacterium]
DADGSWEVVGIAANSKSRTLGEEQKNCVFRFLNSKPDVAVILLGMNILAKTTGDPNAVARPLREEIRAIDPNLAVFGIETMQEHLNKALLIPRVSATLLGVFGTVGLTLAIIGLYGVMSYSVRGRTREIGIRMALGAPKEAVLKGVLRHGMSLAGVGLLIGLGGAFFVGKLSSAYLYGISAADPVTFIAVPVLLITVALVASLVPANRAARVSPSTALRYE